MRFVYSRAILFWYQCELSDALKSTWFLYFDVVGGRRYINNARLCCSLSPSVFLYAISLDISIHWCTPVLVIIMMVVILKRVEYFSWSFPLFLYVCLFIIGSLWCCRRTFRLRLIIFSVCFSFTLTLTHTPTYFIRLCFSVYDRKPRNGLITTRDVLIDVAMHSPYKVRLWQKYSDEAIKWMLQLCCGRTFLSR